MSSEQSTPCLAHGSITRWLSGLRVGDHRAVEALWRRYYAPLCRIARKRLQGARAVDEEAVAAAAFYSFCAAAEKGERFPELSDRNNLIRLLTCFTHRKAYDLAFKKADQQVRGESALGREGFDLCAADEPPPELEVEVGFLLDLLDEKYRPIALFRLQGYTQEEIADEIGCSTATVNRRLESIRRRWESARQ